VDIPANFSRARFMCMLAVLSLFVGHRAKASVILPHVYGACNYVDGAGNFNFCGNGFAQLPDPGNGIEGVSFSTVSSSNLPPTFVSPSGTDTLLFVALPASMDPDQEFIPLLPGIAIPWSYDFSLNSTDPSIALKWSLEFGVDATCTFYDVTVSGIGLGTLTSNGSALTQERTQCQSPPNSSGSFIRFTATVSSIQNGATLTANFPEGSVQINPLDAVPEPASFSLLLSSFGCLALIKKWRAR
jgi:hypothetical protein